MSIELRPPARERITAEMLRKLLPTNTVVVDDRRTRTRFFDGRFLAANDLTREQAYFLTRQAALTRAVGSGVVDGLQVTLTLANQPRIPTQLRIEPGYGLTPSGEAVVLPTGLTVDLAAVPEIQRLDAAFGLSAVPREPARTRSGLYVLALRAVEFTANPVGSYPTTLSGPRTVEDGDVVEATAATLVPYPDPGGDPTTARGRVARDVFLRRGAVQAAGSALPLAMVALERGNILWVDPYLVRRDLRAAAGDGFRLGLAPEALREAHLRQYLDHLDDVLARPNQGRRFAASDHFSALPAAGRFPAAAVDPQTFTQAFFPAEMVVDLSVVPEDEIPALVEESLLLPPIDLSDAGEGPSADGVTALIPVPRAQFRRRLASLTALPLRLRPAAPGLVARRLPAEALGALRLRLPGLPAVLRAPDAAPAEVADAGWRDALAGLPFLWYVRSRALGERPQYAGRVTGAAADDAATDRAAAERLTALGLADRFTALRNRATTAAAAEMVRLFASRAVAPPPDGSPTPPHAALAELEDVEALDLGAALKVAERYRTTRFGEGLARLEGLRPALRDDADVVQGLAKTGAVPELDRLGRLLADDDAQALATAAEAGARDNPAELRGLILQTLQDLPS